MSPCQPTLEQELALLVARHNASDRWLRRYQPAAARRTRQLAARSQLGRTLPALSRSLAEAGADEVDRFFAAVARSVRERALAEGTDPPPLTFDAWRSTADPQDAP